MIPLLKILSAWSLSYRNRLLSLPADIDSGVRRVYCWYMDTQQVITIVLGILSGALAVVTVFQNRLGKIFNVLRGDMQVLRNDMQVLRNDMQAMEGRLGKRIDDVRTELKEDIQTAETRLNARIDAVEESIRAAETRLNARIDGAKTDLKQDIHNAESRLSARIERAETGPRPDEESSAEAV